jgi:hypothetical protein
MTRFGVAVLAAMAVAVSGLAAQASAATVPPPNQDPFYTYSGSLSGLAPGTILKERTIDTVLAADIPTPLKAVQLLFRTTNELGRPTLAVTTAIEPLTGSLLPPKILSWQPFYDSLGPQCDPSYDLRGGATPLGPQYGSSCNVATQTEATAATTFLLQGATVVITDYEDTNESWGAGPLEGYATLDGIRAAESYFHDAPQTTPVALIGYSGGAIATQWADEIAPGYAPELDIAGAAAGGVLVDPIHNLYYINGNGTGWDGVIPVYLLIFQRAFDQRISSYLSAVGKTVLAADSDAYINDLSGNGFTTIQQLLRPRYHNILSIPGTARVFNEMIMGSDGTPKSPIYLENGDGVRNNGWDGDGIMVTGDVEALAHEYCQRGVKVEFQQYQTTHTEAAVPFLAYAITYLTARLAGLPAPSNCSAIGTGDSLAPVPTGAPHAPPAKRSSHQRGRHQGQRHL